MGEHNVLRICATVLFVLVYIVTLAINALAGSGRGKTGSCGSVSVTWTKVLGRRTIPPKETSYVNTSHL